MRKISVLIVAMSLCALTACGEPTVNVVEEPISAEEIKEEPTPEIEEKQNEAMVESEEAFIEEEDIQEETEAVTEGAESDEKIETAEDDDKEEIASNEIRPEFKAAMDEYEKFYDEYCVFMKKYTSSTDPMAAMNMLGDYTKMLQQMEEVDKKFEEWNSKDMTNAETAYYIDVTARIQKKLLDVASN